MADNPARAPTIAQLDAKAGDRETIPVVIVKDWAMSCRSATMSPAREAARRRSCSGSAGLISCPRQQLFSSTHRVAYGVFGSNGGWLPWIEHTSAQLPPLPQIEGVEHPRPLGTERLTRTGDPPCGSLPAPMPCTESVERNDLFDAKL
jgi:hypothetical protein